MGQMHVGLFGPQFDTLANALAARERLQGVHAANIANADTPHYQSDQRDFASFLAEKQGASARTPLATTQPGHFSDDAEPSGWAASLRRHGGTARRMDGNDVDIQKEMAAMAKNQLMHELTLRLLKKRLDGMANIVHEGGR